METLDPRDHPASVVAAQRVMLELATILTGFADAMTIVGGSAPPLLAGYRPDDPYIGTLDVDLVVDPLSVPEETYRSIAELLRGRGYVQMDQPFRWLRSVTIDGRSIDVEVDLLAPITARSGGTHRHEWIGGEPLARRTEGAELVRTGHVDRELAGMLPDGRHNRVDVRVATPATLVILKSLAMSQRDKLKDAYDVDYLLRHVGMDEVADGIRDFGSIEPVAKALAILAEKFRSLDALGPTSVALYRRVQLGSPAADQIQALAYARVDQLLRLART
ncbi:MAG: nucleotidyl transferase AbiEii/AbiGii toxin family protein [Chloroflexota bacterium]